MTYDYTSSKCACASGFVKVGNICVDKAKYDLKANMYDEKNYKGQIKYYDVVDPKTNEVSTFDLNSDVLRQLYLTAAAGCNYKKVPKDCQVLANLCVL